MTFEPANRYRLAAAGVASILALSLAGHAFAQAAPDPDAVRNAVQAAVDRTNTQAVNLVDADARSAYRSAMQEAITLSGARPSVVRVALGNVTCGGANRKEKEACSAELANLLKEVVVLAETELKNGDVAAIRRALLAAVEALGGPPPGGGGGGGAGSFTGSGNP